MSIDSMIIPSFAASNRLYWLWLSNSCRNRQIYKNTFFFGFDKIHMYSQHLSNVSQNKHSSSNGLTNGSGDDSISMSNASAVVCGVPADMIREGTNLFDLDAKKD